MVRKLVFNGKFLSAQPTGVHRVAAELMKSFFALYQQDAELRARFDPQVWVPHDAAAGARELGLPTVVQRPLVGIPWEQFTLPLTARDAVIVSLCNVGPVLARQAVTMFHDAQVRLTPASYSLGFRAWYRFHQPVAARRHRRILTVSAYSAQQLERLGVVPHGKTAVIHNGIDHVRTMRADVGLRRRLALEPCGYVLALANTQVHKNVGLLLRAFARSPETSLKLVLFGSATKADFEQAGHAVPSSVVFAGRVSDDQLAGLYQDALCLAFPSLTEGFGLPPLEAMAWGCPAVVSPCGALPEVCGEAAIRCPPDDPVAWMTAFHSLLNDHAEFVRRREASRSWSSGFTWARSARRLADELLALA